MNDPRETQILLREMQQGNSLAENELFQRYVERLLALARTRMSPQLRTRVDEEDVVQSVYRSFFTKAKEGAYILQRSGDLWRLLAAITLNKVRTQADFHGTQKRSASREIAVEDNSGEAMPLVGPEAAPDEIALLKEETQRVMDSLPTLHRHMVERRLQGESVGEIAAFCSRTEHQVRRVLNKVRDDLERRLHECENG